MHKIYSFLSLILFFTSCTYQKSPISTIHQNKNISLCISMPENVLVFDNVSSLIYKSLQDYFLRVGYNLTDSTKNAFRLEIKIIRLEPEFKFISPDILLYAIRMILELDCKAYNKNNKQIAQKRFTFYSLSSKPSNPIQNPAFLDFEYKKMMFKSAPKIEQFFRKYWIN